MPDKPFEAWISRWAKAQAQFLDELSRDVFASSPSSPARYALQSDLAQLAMVRAILISGDARLKRLCAQWLMYQHLDVATGNELDEDEAREAEWVRAELARLEQDNDK